MRAAHLPWWHTFNPRPPARWRLLCFPHAGGDVTAYRALALALPAHIELAAVQLPGRGVRLRETAFTHLEPLLGALIPALTPLADKPLALFGHSLGALVAFELARAWQLAGSPRVAHLFVSGSRAPGTLAEQTPVNALPDAELIDHLRAIGGTPAEVLAHAELMALMLPVLRADYTIAETYTYPAGPLLDCALSAYGGADDALADREALSGWREHTTGAFGLTQWPGGHFYLAAQTEAVAQAIGRALPA